MSQDVPEEESAVQLTRTPGAVDVSSIISEVAREFTGMSVRTVKIREKMSPERISHCVDCVAGRCARQAIAGDMACLRCERSYHSECFHATSEHKEVLICPRCKCEEIEESLTLIHF